MSCPWPRSSPDWELACWLVSILEDQLQDGGGLTAVEFINEEKSLSGRCSNFLGFCVFIKLDQNQEEEMATHSCLKNPMDRGAWWAAVRGLANSQTRLSTRACTLCFNFCRTGFREPESSHTWPRCPGESLCFIFCIGLPSLW